MLGEPLLQPSLKMSLHVTDGSRCVNAKAEGRSREWSNVTHQRAVVPWVSEMSTDNNISLTYPTYMYSSFNLCS